MDLNIKELEISEDPYGYDYKYFNYNITLKKGVSFFSELKKTLKAEISNWDELPLYKQNFLLNQIFISEVRIRRFLGRYIELIEKLLEAAILNCSFFDVNNKYRTIFSKFAQLDMEQNNFKGKIFFVKGYKNLQDNVFQYFLNIGAINLQLKNSSKLIEKITNINELRNNIYHHRYLFEYSPDIIRGIKSLKGILSAKYKQRFKHELCKELKKISKNQTILKVFANINRILFKIFEIDFSFFQQEINEDNNYYLESTFQEIAKFKRKDPQLFEAITEKIIK